VRFTVLDDFTSSDLQILTAITMDAIGSVDFTRPSIYRYLITANSANCLKAKSFQSPIILSSTLSIRSYVISRDAYIKMTKFKEIMFEKLKKGLADKEIFLRKC